jgi:ubiquitin carboxyl-terminal hydrolase 5/13
LARFFGE